MSQHIDGMEGRWVPDPDDPEFEVWEELGPRTSPEAAAEWDAMLAKNDAARCVAHKKSGERCRRLAIQGATVCRAHGGASGHVRRAARVRLEMAADRVAKELLKLAVSDNAPDNVKLAAIKDALDRAGLSAKTAVEVEVGPSKAFEDVLELSCLVAAAQRPAQSVACPTPRTRIPTGWKVRSSTRRPPTWTTRHPRHVCDPARSRRTRQHATRD